MSEHRCLRSCPDGSLCAPVYLQFAVGRFTAPVTLGSGAEVGIAGAQRAQARAYFDGATLFMCSVSINVPAIVNGAALSTLWAPVFCPSVVWLGDTRLEYAVASEPSSPVASASAENPWGGHTVMMNVPQALNSASAGPCVELFALNHAFESVTVTGPPPSLEVIAGLVAHVAGPAKPGRQVRQARPTPTSISKVSASLGVLSRLRARLRDDFRRTPRNIRMTLFALPIVAWGALTLGSPTDPALRAPSKTARPSAAAQRNHQTEAQPASPHVALTLSATNAAPPEKTSIPPVLRGKRTLEASAADAAARGSYSESSEMYEELATLSPNRPEFAVAARILRSKQAFP